MKLSDRLTSVASLIKDHANVADVGADHGLLEIFLLENKKVDSIMAIENKSGPFSILKNNLKDYDVKLSLSSGIEAIDEKVDTLVIAGMGGMLIVDILKAHKEKLDNIKQIVIDAHRDNEYVRKEITNLGFYIEKEKIVFEKGTYYFVISFLKGHKEHSQDDYEWGYNITEDPLFKQFQTHELSLMNRNLIKYQNSKNATQSEIENRKAKIERLEKL